MERDIDYVIAVAECGSISQAAEVLYISQPSLSRYLSSLENELGVALFIRTIDGTELTEAGKLYVEYAKEIGADMILMTRSSRGPIRKLGSVATYIVRNASFLDVFVMREEGDE